MCFSLLLVDDESAHESVCKNCNLYFQLTHYTHRSQLFLQWISSNNKIFFCVQCSFCALREVNTATENHLNWVAESKLLCWIGFYLGPLSSPVIRSSHSCVPHHAWALMCPECPRPRLNYISTVDSIFTKLLWIFTGFSYMPVHFESLGTVTFFCRLSLLNLTGITSTWLKKKVFDPDLTNVRFCPRNTLA